MYLHNFNSRIIRNIFDQMVSTARLLVICVVVQATSAVFGYQTHVSTFFVLTLCLTLPNPSIWFSVRDSSPNCILGETLLSHYL